MVRSKPRKRPTQFDTVNAGFLSSSQIQMCPNLFWGIFVFFWLRREEELNMINHYQSPQGFQDCALIVTSPATTRHQYHHCYHQVPLKNPNVWSQNPPSNEPIHDPPEPLIYYQYQTISSAMSITIKPECHIDHCRFQFEPFPRVPRPIPRATNMHHIPGCRLRVH